MENIVSGADAQIGIYKSKFNDLKLAFQGRAVLQTEIAVFRIVDDIKKLGEYFSMCLRFMSDFGRFAATEVDLNDIPYAEGARFQRENGCLPGTRKDIISEISQWINSSNSDDAHRILLLSGVAGSGKSAIANSMAQLFNQLGRLGSSFCFDRAQQAKRRPDNVFSTIARDLADLDPPWKRSLCSVV